MNISRKYITTALFFVLASFSISAQVTKRALIIGIDIYKPENVSGASSRGTWTNLDGCVNDALSIKATLISKYGFTENNITFLANDKATKNDIINGLKNLIATSKKGDIVFIYYAGHGSQIKNISSQETDGKDETMVPADAYLGISDIRDKELNELFYQLAEKGVILTIIYDSCHSGSIGRGLAEKEPKSRYLQPVANAQVDDPSTPHNLIEKNVLIISAAQDFETAKEQVDEQNNPHGAFTFAFLQALKTLPANSPAIKIFESIRAVVKYNGKSQEPVFEGNETRRNQSIIGTPRETISNTTTLAVLKNESKDNITIQGGYISGINENCILRKIYEKDTVTLQITSVNGANSSTAKIIKGNFSLVKAGDMFDVTKWTFSGQSSLKIYIPSGSFDLTTLTDVAAKIYSRLKSNEKINIVTDPTSADILYTIYFNGESWVMHKPGGDTIKLGKTPAGNFVKQIPDGSKVFVSLPAYKELKNLLTEFYKTNNAVAISSSSSQADYILSGRYNNNAIEYAFVSSADPGKKNEAVMPERTDFIKFTNVPEQMKKSADTLTGYSVRIAKIKAWLTLESPPDDGSFPYYLALRNSSTGKIISSGEIKEGEIYGIVLVKDAVNAKQWDGSKRFVYVSTIDSKGKSALMFPLSNVENRFPMTDELPDTIFLGKKQLFRVSPPYGFDHYILLALDEQLPNPDVFNSEGVQTRSSSSPLFQYLVNGGIKTRGSEMFNTPSSWKKQVMTIKSGKK